MFSNRHGVKSILLCGSCLNWFFDKRNDLNCINILFGRLKKILFFYFILAHFISSYCERVCSQDSKYMLFIFVRLGVAEILRVENILNWRNLHNLCGLERFSTQYSSATNRSREKIRIYLESWKSQLSEKYNIFPTQSDL